MTAKKILFADDDENDIKLMLIALERNGMAEDAQAVCDGSDVLEYLRCQGDYAARAPGDPRVVVLDLKMRMLDGFDALAQIRADPAFKRIPVVIMSSSAQRKDIERCYELGANAYVVKPHHLDELTEALRHIVSFWVSTNRFPDREH
jgi:CheY-like chemotaxis protein